MNRLLLLIIALAACSVVSYGQANADFAQKITKKFDQYNQTIPQEKVYLHTDKPYYATGDTVWLKAYVVYANSTSPDTITRLVYVDLVAESGKTVRFHQLKMKLGMAQGFVSLDSLRAGAYRLRAYTNWMRNFSEVVFFQQTLQIFDPNANLPVPDFDSTALDLQFFPEGGQLVAGLNNRLAFKATNALGRGVAISGFVLSAAGDTVVGFSSRYLGMGYLNISPAVAETYTAYCKREGGSWIKAPLPAVMPTGFALQVDNFTNKNNVRVIIQQNKGGTAEQFGTLIIHGGGEVRLSAKVPLARKTSLLNVPRNQLAEGVNHLTLFDEQDRPVCERLLWIADSSRLEIRVAPLKTTYKPREKVELEITAQDLLGRPAKAHLSLAVTDGAQVRELEKYPQNIVSYLKLSSEVRGQIEEPASYFDPKNTASTLHLDYLLMTQGWRRFTWQEILQDSLPKPAYFVEQGVSLVGSATRPNKKSAGVVKITAFVTLADTSQLLYSTESDEQGNFGFYALDFADSARVLVQGATLKGGRNLLVKLQTPKPPTAKPEKQQNSLEKAAVEEYLKRLKDYLRIEAQIRKSGEQLLQEIVVKAKKTVIPDARKIYSSADATLKASDFANRGAQNPLEVLQGRVAGVNVTGNGVNVQVSIRGAANFSGPIEPLYILDGTPVSRDAILSIPVTDLESIDVLKGASASIYGSQGAGGVLAFFTKRGSPNYDYSQEETPGVIVTKWLGYQVEREYYTPKYDKKPAFERPDFRSTLTWLPNIQTDENGKAKVSFYHSDSVAPAQINVQGLSAYGFSGVATGSYAVK